MHFRSFSATIFLSLTSYSDALRNVVRSNPSAADNGAVVDQHQRRLPGRGNTKSEECLFVAAAMLETDPGTIEDVVIDCQLPSEDMNGFSGIIKRVDASPQAIGQLKAMHARGEIKSGETLLKHGAGAAFDEGSVFFPPGWEVAGNHRQDEDGSRRRRLAVHTGDKPMLAVRVTDVNGLAYGHTATVMSDNIFGTDGDAVNLKSQLAACSFDQLNINPGTLPNPDSNEEAAGVIEVTIPIDITAGSDRYAIHNAVTTAVQTKLDHPLPGPYQQVMYILEKCYTGCGWAAYAYINSWMSVYQDRYYYMPGVQIHELGHNFGMAHSGGLDGQTYTDHTGLMGNPLYSDDVGKMCYNPAKNYYLGWYDADGGKKNVDPTAFNFESTELTMVGISEYDSRTDNAANQPVVVKLETGTNDDYFVAYNRANRANSDNDEADNEVTIVKTGNNGNSYSQSFLQATLVQGEAWTLANFGGTGKTLSVKATSITTGSPIGIATICITFDASGDCAATTPPPTNVPTSPPTNVPTDQPTNQPTKSPVPPTSPPTNQPTDQPTNQPTKSPVPPTSPPTNQPTDQPTNQPTKSPVPPTPQPTNPPTDQPTNPPTKSPTLPPTNQPTKQPTQLNCANFTDKWGCQGAGCSWVNNRGTKTCEA